MAFLKAEHPILYFTIDQFISDQPSSCKENLRIKSYMQLTLRSVGCPADAGPEDQYCRYACCKSIKKGACAESIGTSPVFRAPAGTQICEPYDILGPGWLLLRLSNQPDIVEVHLSRAARCRAALGAEADGDRIDIREIHAGKARQVDDPFGPVSYLRYSRVIVIDD